MAVRASLIVISQIRMGVKMEDGQLGILFPHGLYCPR
jgi:hypothetical protein